MRQLLRSVLLALAMAPALATSEAAQTLVGSVQSFQTDGDGGEGAAASVDWIHSSDGRVVSLGLTHKSVGNADWTLGRFGAALDVQPRLQLAGEIELGPAEFAGTEDTYCRIVTQLTITASEQLFLGLEDQYFDVERTHGHLFSAKLAYLPIRALAVEARVSHSGGGNLGTRLVSGRVDYFARLHLLAGAAHGRSTPDVFDVSTGSGNDLRQYFAGIGFPVVGNELTLMSEWLELGDTRQQITTLVISVPLTARK